MKKNWAFIFPILMLSMCSRQGANVAGDYYIPGELSSDHYLDSVRRKNFSEELNLLDELPLRASKENSYSLRLLVSPSFFNPYCIRITKDDSVYRITFKILGDRRNRFLRQGIENLTLAFESSDQRMDSLFSPLQSKLSNYDFYPGFDKSGLVIADGVYYVLEQYDGAIYKVVMGVDGNDYPGSRQLADIFDNIHSLVPTNLIPNPSPNDPESQYFEILRRR